MKMPMPPPSLEELMNKLRSAGVDRFIDLVTIHSQIEVASMPYLPWHEFRYKKPPRDLTSEEWWLVTKLGRQALQRKTALLDKDKRHFTYALTDDALKAIEEVNRHLSGHIGMGEKVASSANRDRYLMSSLMEEAITSSQLEGAVTTRAVAKEMIRSGRAPANRDERMILNNYNAMRRVRDLLERDLSIDLIQEIHRIVTDGTLENPSAAGRFQQPGEERVIVGDLHNTIFHIPPPAKELEERLQRLCDFANSAGSEGYMPGVIRAITLHFMLGYDHPFEDGNGRTARVLFYWSMLKQGYWLTEFLSISRILKRAPVQYGNSYIHTEQDDSDLTYFVLYQLKVIQRAIRELHLYLERKVQEMREFQRSLATMPNEFNHRQVALLQHALRHSDNVYTVQSHGRSHGVVRQTARQDLFDLEQRGLLRRIVRGRKFSWTPEQNLVDKLKAGQAPL